MSWDKKLSTRPNLYLTGFMGTGKSAVGHRVAPLINAQFVDADCVIAERVGMDIPSIFAQYGEASFRKLEREFVASGHPNTGCVVACGGGLIIQPGMLEALEKRGVLICLFASLETVLKRTSGKTSRPLLNVDDPKTKIQRLMAERLPIYRKVRLAVSTDNASLSAVVKRIVLLYQREIALKD